MTTIVIESNTKSYQRKSVSSRVRPYADNKQIFAIMVLWRQVFTRQVFFLFYSGIYTAHDDQNLLLFLQCVFFKINGVIVVL